MNLVYFSSTVYLELGHTDIIEGSFRAIPKLFSHDCTEREVHRPLGKDDQRPVCVRSSQTTAYVESNVYFSPPAFEIIGVCVVRNSFPHRERVCSDVRGPPSLSI